jgi:hypothetical protein
MGSRPRDSTRVSRARSAATTSQADINGSSRRKTRQVVPRADIPIEIQDVLDRERRRLRQASAVLSCLKFAALYQQWHEEIDTADVADLVHRLVDTAFVHLDSIELARSVKELDEHDTGEGPRTEDD